MSISIVYMVPGCCTSFGGHENSVDAVNSKIANDKHIYDCPKFNSKKMWVSL